MKLIIKLLINALVVFLLANYLPGVSISGYGSAIIVVIVLSILNTIVKPILQILSFPITVITLGLFLLVINALIVMMCDGLVSGFNVSSFWTALLFSLLLTILQSIIETLLSKD